VTGVLEGRPDGRTSVRAENRFRSSIRDGVEVHASIAEIEPDLWDSILDRDDLQATHRFVSTCEESGIEDASYRHILVHAGGRLVGTATLSEMSVSLDLLAPRAVRGAISAARGLHPGFLRVPVVFCGLPVSFGQSCLRFHPSGDRNHVVRAVAQAMAEFAGQEGAAVLCLKEFSDAEAGHLHALEAMGYIRARSLPACPLRLEWRTFEEYLAALRAPYRRQILADLHARGGRGVELRLVEDFSEETAPIFALYEQVIDRAEFRLERLNLAFLKRLNANLGSETRALFLETREGRCLAVAVLLYTPRTLTFLLAGIDYEANREHRAYLNLVAAVVAEGIRVGAEVLELGQTSYALKTRLGGRPDPRWIYLRARSPIAHHALRSTAAVLFPATRTPARRVFRKSG